MSDIHALLEELRTEVEEHRRKHPVRAWFRARWISTRWHWGEFKRRLRWIKWGFQRARKGYSEWDTWSFDRHLARVIGHGLIDLRDNTHSYPIDSSPHEWWLLLTEMADPLIIYAHSDHLDRTPEDMADVYANAVAALHLVADHFGDLWD